MGKIKIAFENKEIQITCNIMMVKNSRSSKRPKIEAEMVFAL